MERGTLSRRLVANMDDRVTCCSELLNYGGHIFNARLREVFNALLDSFCYEILHVDDKERF